MMSVYILEIDILSFDFIFMMLPSYLADAWLFAQFIRTLLTGERWPMRRSKEPTQEQTEFMMWRTRGILAAILYFVLMIIIQGGAFVLTPDLMRTLGMDTVTKEWHPNMFVFAVFMAGIVFLVWAVRFLWLYIPLVILAPLKEFVEEIKGFMTSVYLVSIWLLSVVPILFVLVLIPALLMEPYYESLYETPRSVGFVIVFLRVLADTFSGMVVIAAITYSFKDILIKYGAKPIFEKQNKPF